jgi:hypothetical protein
MYSNRCLMNSHSITDTNLLNLTFISFLKPLIFVHTKIPKLCTTLTFLKLLFHKLLTKRLIGILVFSLVGFTIDTHAQSQLDPSILLDTEAQIKRATNTSFLLEFARLDSIRYYAEKERAIRRAQLTNSPIRGKSGAGGNYELQGFDDAGQLLYYTTNNNIAANTISTNRVRPGGSAGLNLTGQGVTIRLWEGSPVRTTHQEFGGRVTQVDGFGASGEHATHVAAPSLHPALQLLHRAWRIRPMCVPATGTTTSAK